MKDPIVEEVHEIRRKQAAKFNYDIDAIFDDLQKRQKKLGKRLVKGPLKKKKKACDSAKR